MDPTWSLEFDLQDPLEVAGTLQIALFGAFQAPTINPDHHVVVSINGTQVGDVKMGWAHLGWLLGVCGNRNSRDCSPQERIRYPFFCPTI